MAPQLSPRKVEGQSLVFSSLGYPAHLNYTHDTSFSKLPILALMCVNHLVLLKRVV